MSLSIQSVRDLLGEHGLSAVIIPTGDPHSSEYPCPHWELRKALCPFTGSAGCVVITSDKALLWTDSRYWEQARIELEGTLFTLMRDGDPATPRLTPWLCENLPVSSRIGIDAGSYALKPFSKLQTALKTRGMTLGDVSEALYALWDNRPELQAVPVLPFESGQRPRSEKFALTRAAMKKAGADTLLVSALDDVAWLCNLRGSDLPNTPVFLAYLLIRAEVADLFINLRKLGPATVASLRKDSVRCHPYEAISEALRELSPDTVFFVDPTQMNAHLYQSVANGVRIVTGTNPVTVLKTRKNPEELALIQESMVDEGIALVSLFSWIENQTTRGVVLSEWDVSEKLLELRKQSPRFIETSFTTIAAVGANASQPHYAPSPKKSDPLRPGTMLLLDSGGQYLTGTTDITRTIGIGPVSEAMKKDYTTVLRAHIALAKARFPTGLHAGRLDSLARSPLWQAGADYGHGTGHGVGFVLNVHEAPLSISPRTPATDATRLVEGIVVSNEPGLYRAGLWGVRLENLVTPVRSAFEGFSEFETLSLCPFDRTLILTELLTKDEKLWVDTYHALVCERLAPYLGEVSMRWLEKAIAPL